MILGIRPQTQGIRYCVQSDFGTISWHCISIFAAGGIPYRRHSECRFWLQLTASILGSRQLDDRKVALSSHLIGTHVRCYCPKCRGVPGNASSFSVCAASLSRLPFLSPSRHVPFENPTSALIKSRSGLCCFSLLLFQSSHMHACDGLGFKSLCPSWIWLVRCPFHKFS